MPLCTRLYQVGFSQGSGCTLVCHSDSEIVNPFRCFCQCRALRSPRLELPLAEVALNLQPQESCIVFIRNSNISKSCHLLPTKHSLSCIGSFCNYLSIPVVNVCRSFGVFSEYLWVRGCRFLLGQQLTYGAGMLPNSDRGVYVCIHLKFIFANH